MRRSPLGTLALSLLTLACGSSAGVAEASSYGAVPLAVER
jgi:hypothetical protein